MKAPRDLTIGSAAHRMRMGELTAQALIESCLERIHEREDTVHAWVEVYEREALEEARKCDEDARIGKWRGDLHGIPVGVKDIIDVKGMWTRAGTSIYPASVANADAPVVRKLRASGAIFLGKTETTPFANSDPTITRNPWNPTHTPGGSSSGSGAAVADRMCMAALGTQTGGSLLRPAAYNGIVGFKPTYGYISAERVLPNAWSLDHVGHLARCVADAGILWRRLREEQPSPFARIPIGKKTSPCQRLESSPRLGYILDFFQKETSSEVMGNLEQVRATLKEAGATVVEFTLPENFNLILKNWDIIKHVEVATFHQTLFEKNREQYPPKIKARIEKGLTIPGHQYVEALHHRIAFQREMSERLASVDAVFMPIATSTAPQGLGSTGSSVFNQPWTFTGFPAMSIPTGLDKTGLPFAMQLASLPMAETLLLEVASWCERVLAFTHSPK